MRKNLQQRNRWWLTVASFVWAATALAAPGDAPSAGANPVQFDSGAPHTTDAGGLVSSTGEASYRVPFEVPPGRNGAQPRVELVYSSRAPLRGGIAAGWTLPIPTIHVDTRYGRAAGVVYAIDSQRLSPSSDVAITPGATTYRADGDGSYAIYEHVLDGTETGYWYEHAADGSIRVFGYDYNTKDHRTDDGAQFGGQGRWFLNTTVDARGNAVDYVYETVYGSAHDGALANTPIDVDLTEIDYGRNINVRDSVNYASIKLQYVTTPEMCSGSAVPIGAQFDFSTGIRRYRGAKRLVWIRSSVLDPTTHVWTLRREIAPQYDVTAMSCTQPHAPLRLMSGVQLRAWMADGTLVQPPPTTFTYGPLDYAFADAGAGSDIADAGGPVKATFGNTTYAVTRSMSADLDGDGRPDSLVAGVLPGGGCTINGIAVPGLPWANGSSPQSTNDPVEACGVDIQIAGRPFDAGSTNGCGPPQQANQARFLDLSGDGLPDLVTQLSYRAGNWYDPAADSALENEINPQHLTDYPACSTMPVQPCTATDGSPSACLLDLSVNLLSLAPRALGVTRGNGTLVTYSSGRETCATVPDMRCGFYVLRMYKNLGHNVFATTPTMVYSPVPLATVSQSNPWDNGALANAEQAHAMVDLDGDGRLDGVYLQTSGPGGIPQLSIWRGYGQGLFSTSRIDWSTPGLSALNGLALSSYFSNGTQFNIDYATSSFHDINGDGLPDLVLYDATLGMTVRFNTGNGFESVATILGGPNRDHTAPPMSWMSATLKVDTWNSGSGMSGYVVATRRAVDLDGDGLVDVAALPQPVGGQPPPMLVTPSVTPFINFGDKLMPQTMSAAAAAAWYGSLLNIKSYAANGNWTTNTDVRDDDGDGLPEVRQVSASGCNDPSDYSWCGRTGHISEAQPLAYRLLTKIDNGLGVVTTIGYGSARDASLVTTTVQDATHRVSRPLSLVRQVDVASSAAPTASTAYAYQDPLTAADPFGHVDFRGFEQVTTVGPAANSGARKTTITRYDYSLDKLGRVSEVLTLDGNTLTKLAQTKWAQYDVGGASSFQRLETFAYHCAPRSSETIAAQQSDCVHNDTALLEHHALSWVPIHDGDSEIAWNGASSTGTARAWVATLDRRGGAAGAVGDRADATSYHVVKPWLVLPDETLTLQSTSATGLTGAKVLAHTKTVYDAGGVGLPVETQVEVTPGVFAKSERTFDAYGNVLTLMRPNQTALGSAGKVQSHVYDAFGAYAIATIDELNHRTERDWDLAFGKVTAVRGPQQGTVMPYDNTTYDPVGRVVRRARLGVNNNGTTFDFVYFTAKYGDTIDDHSVTSSWSLDYGAASSKTEKDSLDGFGRVIQKSLATSATANEVTTVHYDAAGNVIAVDVPNPATGSSGTVTYTATYDGLGRTTRSQAPGQAVVATSYSAQTTTVTNGPTDDSVRYVKVTNRDAFGRLTRVIEGATTHATTLYAYDALDRMSRITDADGIVTTLAYTVGGQRSSITRAGTTLSYDYDLDGNRLAVHQPLPDGTTGVNAAYTSTWSYDALDRVAVALPATRDLSSAQLARYANGATVYSYDEPARKFGVGRLTTVTYPFGTVGYDHSIEGWTSAETRNFSVAPDGTTFTAGGKQVVFYAPTGDAAVVTYPDDATAPTSARLVYDLQGRPNRLDIGTAGNNFHVGVAIFNRNAAGLVATRTASGNATTEQTFEYDASGRITKDTINGLPIAGGSMAALAGETLVYRQDGSVKSLADGGSGRSFAVAFDELQQLKSATATDYSAAFAYSPAGTIRSANVSSTAPGAQVVNRNVTYDFTVGSGDVADPAAVRKLVASNGTTFASFAYDASSNLKQRVVAGATTAFAYDGADRLREAQTASGDEVYFYDEGGTRILTYRAASGGRPAQLVHRFGTTEILSDAAGGHATTTDLVLGGHPVARVVNHDVTSPRTLYHGVVGNLLAVLDVNKVLVARYGYGPFGELLSTEGPEAASYDHTYEDKARDALTGLSYFGHRYYDPVTTTWTQADPLFRFAPDLAYSQPRRMNLFTYALNSPLRYVDADGLDPKVQTGGAPTAGPQPGQCRNFDGCGLGAGVWGNVGNPSDADDDPRDKRLDEFKCNGHACQWSDIADGSAEPLTPRAAMLEFELFGLWHGLGPVREPPQKTATVVDNGKTGPNPPSGWECDGEGCHPGPGVRAMTPEEKETYERDEDKLRKQWDEMMDAWIEDQHAAHETFEQWMEWWRSQGRAETEANRAPEIEDVE